MRAADQGKGALAPAIPARWAYGMGLVVVLGSEFLLRDVFLPERADDVRVGIATAGEWLVLIGLVAFWMPRVEGSGLGSVGLGRPRWRYLWVGAIMYVAAFLAGAISGSILESVGIPSIRSLQPMLSGYRLPVLLSLFLTGTILEEVFYRGYLIERLTFLTGRRWLAAGAAWLAFLLVHLRFFGLGPTIDVSVFSAALVLLYLKEKSIWPCMVMHGMNNLLAYLVFPLLTR